MSNGFIYVVDAHCIDRIEEENVLDPSNCDKDMKTDVIIKHVIHKEEEEMLYT